MKKQNLLQKKDLPKNYLNISYYLKKHLGELPDPPLDPKTKQPIGPEALAAIFPMEIIKQEVSLEEKIPIPDEVREIYAAYRPTPLIRAKRLERALDTSAHIYFKFEGASMVGNHKINSALAQAYYNKQEGVEELITETGAGQWGTALALATRMFGLRCTVFMVKCSYEQKPYRKTVMQLYGAKVFASPSRETVSGRKFLEKYPNTSGSLGMAISEAIEIAVGNPKNKYSLGSVLNHVMLHQTVIGQEAKKQMEYEGDYPDIVIGCCGGGANLGGIAFPFIADKLSGAKPKLRVVAVEPTTCASLTKGKFEYDFGDTAGMTPLLLMYTLGHDFMPSPIHAGGLRYHGASPIVSLLLKEKIIEAKAYDQLPVFEAAVMFAKNQGIVPAPESAHAIKAVIDEALECKKTGEAKTILFNLSGHGLFDMSAYDNYLSGNIK